ncbi:MAG: PBSX family phage terminase large subunit [Flavobacterium sp.]|nr:PBSX family phage terminase large subunit [Flavobacterium sp.]
MYKINEAFKPLYTSKKRYFFITGGRGSLKSTSVHDFISRLTYDKGHGILVTRYTMTSAEKSIIPEFKIVATRNGSINDFIITSSKITNKLTGSFILFSGIKTSSGDQTANLKSLAGITTWVIDEGEDFKDEKTFDDIDDSIRTNEQQNRVIWIQNPSTIDHFIHKRWVEKTPKILNIEGFDVITSNNKNVEAIHTTYHIAKDYLSESILEKIEEIRIAEPKKYLHKYLGAWLDKAEGVVFTNWKFGDFNPDQLQTSFGMDFGFSIDPDTLTEVAIDIPKKKLYLKQHIYQNKLKTHELCQLVKSITGDKLIVGDSSESRLIGDMQAYGINIVPVKKGTIESGVVRMQDFEIIIEYESYEIAKEFNNYVYLNKAGKLYIDAYNHAIDGSRYNVIYHLDNPNQGKYFVY